MLENIFYSIAAQNKTNTTTTRLPSYDFLYLTDAMVLWIWNQKPWNTLEEFHIGESVHDKMSLQQCLSLRWEQELYYFGSDREDGPIAPNFSPSNIGFPSSSGPHHARRLGFVSVPPSACQHDVVWYVCIRNELFSAVENEKYRTIVCPGLSPVEYVF